ncbi:hypothetical protein ONE63_006048 [Megalurothrips usitatus]|uniref:Zinc finger homeobox protein 4 n=1 Tax=Megalurothrips usitatus TaxID=439358 RepID=A0AAV7XW63_9NEOP|nr:hypothetical protein ONE63_006048 [Megalurothrips usitatus]
MPTPQDDGSPLDEPRGPGPGLQGPGQQDGSSMSPEEETAAPPAALMAASRQPDDERRVTSPPTGSKYDDVPMTTTLAHGGAEEAPSAAAGQPSADAEDSWGTNDVEKFDGKIVYNPDGSAYIIEDSELSEEEIGDGCIVDGRGVSLSEQNQVFPQIANAFYVSRNPALYSALYGQQQQQQQHQQQQAALASRHQPTDVPVMHSYRVYSVRDGKGAEDKDDKEGGARKQLKIPAQEATSVPVKPILMCFVCKLSFGYTKSFVAHAMGDHNLVLRDDEKEILSQQNASAIIQVVGKEKEPLLSFLEPVPPSRPGPEHDADREHRDRDEVEAQSLVVHRRSVDRASASPQRPTPQQSPQQHPRLPQPHVPETSPVSLSQNGSNNSNNFLSFNHQRLMVNGLNSVMDLTRKSPVGPASGPPSHGRNSVSPGASPSPSPLQLGNPFAPPPPSFLTGTTIGVCPDHIGGRPSGVECSKCELILSSSRLGGPLANMHSRNSCKTLKCPKCNWHYKYQETLEIHMKEKHPETETSCLYCIAGQPHPRLARGETYTCGYKPYRCEVCNYSTTTKGNLSIHMQSDKHLNNMQELQNGGVSGADALSHPALQTPPPKSGAGLGSPSVPAAQPQQKPKPTFRCDVCNYETNVARNLRIHMTSEKHTHNMMVLQQSMKHMQTLSALQQSHQQQLSLESLLHFHPGLLPGGLPTGLPAGLPGPDKPPPHSEQAALADMAYNQALLIQMMTGGQMPPHIPPELAPHMDMGLNPETMEPPPGPADPNPTHLFHCCVCNAFSTDSLEQLSHHLSEDRTRIREQEILAVVAGHYVCKLCSYKTNLKANFQLHCKTDKHLQRLQHVNHVKEGGPRNEWKLKYVTSPGGIQVRCHACDYYTNSAHKLQLHAAGQRHEASCLLFRHLRECEAALREDHNTAPRIYHCALCGFSARARLPLLQHIRSMKHVQMEQLHQLQRRAEGKDVQTDIGEIFQVLTEPQPFGDMDCDKEQQQLLERERERERDIRERENRERERERERARSRERSRERDSVTPQDRQGSPATDGAHQCPYCNYTASSELRVQAHVLAHHQSETPVSPQRSPQRDFLCPLCQDAFRDRTLLEKHVMQIHSVNSEGLQRLLSLVDQSHWLNASTRPGPGTPSSQQPTTPQHTPPGNLNSPSSVASSTGCKELQDSGSSGKLNHSDNNSGDVDEQELVDDQDDLLRCHACSRSFRSFEELCAHQSEAGHLEFKQTPLGSGYLCWKKGCNQYFPSANSLQMHFREIHLRGVGQPGVAVSEKHVYKYRCSQCSLAFKTMEKLQLHSQYHIIRDATKCVLCGRSFRSVLALHKHVETAHPELTEEELNAYKQSLMNNPLVLAGITGPVLDPVTNELLRKESMRMDDDVMDSEESPAKDNADESFLANTHDGDNSDDSIVYKEQQFLEDYLNSQAMAEDSYNDPNRKYKCHRCKVAYTRQSYLTAHNKTLLHRKGEKLTYPMEKYLDPNRPYKCDVCKESFTQKNILLVHYNSVSHLHKLKRAMQEQQNNNNNNNTKDTLASLGVTSPPNLPPGMPLTPKSQSSSASDDDDKKPYKCNICRVAYSQGSTLDIHMRSVLHQTRASKLQDLAITGQIDLSKPLIEQPEPRSKLIQDILGASPKLAPPQSLSSSLTSPPSGGSTGTAQGSPTVPSSLGSSSASAQSSVIGSDPLACPRCSALFASPEQLATHQQLYCLFGSPINMFGMGGVSPQSSNNRTPPPFQSTPEDTFARLSVNKKSSQMYKHLLESFGFDLVMQFNENHQRRKQKEREDLEKAQQQLQEQAEQQAAQQQLEAQAAEEQREPEKVEEIEEEPKETKEVVVKEEQPDEEARPSTPSEKDHLPEVSKSTCTHCNKEFSSVWVLKAHCEEVHKDLVPLDFLEKYAQQFKSEYEKKSVPGGSGVDSTPEKEQEDSKEHINKSAILTPPSDVPVTPTAPSTPTASSTPASSSDNMPATNTTTTAPPALAGLSPSAAQGLPMNLAQQMDSMQMALNAMAVQQHLQQQLNPMMLGMMGLPLGLNMQALAAMNLQPPLVPLMMPPPPFDPMAAQNPLFSPQGQNIGDPAALLAKQQQALMQQQQQVQKRARTRITDEQLKILRAHFDINNSPSEEQIHDMAARSGLPPKVIKHWFRNTLFKERQRNKDSPYNFNNPPSTTLNLEEYEKTGEAKVIHLNTSSSSDEQKPAAKPVTPAPPPVQQPPPPQPPKPSQSSQQQPREQLMQQQHMQQQLMQQQMMHQFPKPPEQIKTEPNTEHIGIEREDYHLSPTPSHASRSSSPASLTLSSLIASQLGPDPLSHGPASMLPPKLTPPNFASPTHGAAPGPMTPNSRSVSPGRSFNDPFTHLGSNNSGSGSGGGANSSGSSSSGGSTGKRANRTRFTDYQIKVLQEFFENNAYPKDDDLEYLSKLLSLSPRVIVVWFQNARQKARKVYENQPAVDPAPGTGGTDEQGRFQRTPGLNYQCKKCLLVFQRYYELIRHQKTHCFKEEDAKRSAQAQAAAAQIAAVMSSEDSNSSTMTEQREPPAAAPQPAPQASTAALTASSGPTTPAPGSSAHTPTPSPLPDSPRDAPRERETQPLSKESSFQCDKCNLVFPRFELWREHQLVHIMNPNLFPTYPPDSPFGILQQHAQLQQQQQQQQGQQQPPPPPLAALPDLSLLPGAGAHPLANMLGAGVKRKLEELDEPQEQNEPPKDKRLRTTILPEQLDYLYQKYQMESNPSRKMLENIAREVGLKKRVVQVWFQNTRARERKGQVRAHSQVINKRCPFCPALFKVKSALESHLNTKHADQCARGEINIDALPDEEVSMESTQSSQHSSAQPNMMPPLFPPFQSPDVEASLKKYYEESVKRYISELQAHQTAQNGKDGGAAKEDAPQLPGVPHIEGGAGVLDLSKPVDLSRPLGMALSVREDPISEHGDDSMSECTDNMDDESNPTSPASSTQSGHQRSGPTPTTPGQPGQPTNKRFRTQMSSLQVKIMKSLFADYKTPTMAECEMLGREIGLAKRVVQVWFQNARAKEKKTKLALQKALGGPESLATPPPDRAPEECVHCQFKYSHKYSIQDHIFTKKHIDNVRQYLETHKDAQPGAEPSMPQLPVPGALPVALPGHAPSDNNNAPKAAPGINTLPQEDLNLLQQLYGSVAPSTGGRSFYHNNGECVALE